MSVKKQQALVSCAVRRTCSSILSSERLSAGSGLGREHREAIAVESVSRMILCNIASIDIDSQLICCTK